MSAVDCRLSLTYRLLPIETPAVSLEMVSRILTGKWNINRLSTCCQTFFGVTSENWVLFSCRCEVWKRG